MKTSESIISDLLEETSRISKTVKEKFSVLSFDRLNFRNEKYAWSAAECFDHLIVTNNQYIPLIEAALEKSSKGNPEEEFKTTFTGRFLLYSVNPDNMKKTKSPRIYRPELKLYTKEVIKFFIDQHNHITALICKSQDKNLSSIKVSSPVTPLLRFNLGEAFQIIIQHDWRHIGQAGRILNI
jgi:hypothetical protein